MSIIMFNDDGSFYNTKNILLYSIRYTFYKYKWLRLAHLFEI